jgi:menaquinone-dependent protoporphyrinogen oxidase
LQRDVVTKGAAMCEVPVFYATSEGQTRLIAQTLASELRARGVESEALDIQSAAAERFDWQRARLVVIGASVHVGRHQRQAAAFVKRHLEQLGERPAVFMSVSLAIASALPNEVEAARRIAQAFPTELGWRPVRTVCIAGRLAFTQYGWLTRFMMRRIAAKAGGPTDTRRDHEMTNWDEVRHLAEAIVGLIERGAPVAEPRSA